MESVLGKPGKSVNVKTSPVGKEHLSNKVMESVFPGLASSLMVLLVHSEVGVVEELVTVKTTFAVSYITG